jgi:hypothetical protein
MVHLVVDIRVTDNIIVVRQYIDGASFQFEIQCVECQNVEKNVKLI